jgi:hypothetical protein
LFRERLTLRKDDTQNHEAFHMPQIPEWLDDRITQLVSVDVSTLDEGWYNQILQTVG